MPKEYIERSAAINAFYIATADGDKADWCVGVVQSLPAADVREVPEGGIGEMSDGYHTFNGLYYQRMVLFAALVNAHNGKAWKSWKHEDGKPCFGGGWFIVGIDTPKGSYTYHYEDKYWNWFECEELPVAKHWDGHTEEDVTRLLSLPDVREVVHGGKRVLDPCCGSKMMWFDRNNPDVEFCDIREVDNEKIWQSKDGSREAYLTVAPNTIADVRHLPFPDNTFYHIVFDPPHLLHISENAWLCKKYGKLDADWREFIHDSFIELMRVLKPNGTLMFKWGEIDITVSELLRAIPYKPLYGHRSGKHMTTHWMAFIKDDDFCPNCGADMRGEAE